MIDPFCLIHGKKQSEHDCLYCCMCFEELKPEDCFVNKAGIKEDVCESCGEREVEQDLMKVRWWDMGLKDKSQYFSGLGKGRKEGRREALEWLLGEVCYDRVECEVIKKELERMKNA